MNSITKLSITLITLTQGAIMASQGRMQHPSGLSPELVLRLKTIEQEEQQRQERQFEHNRLIREAEQRRALENPNN